MRKPIKDHLGFTKSEKRDIMEGNVKLLAKIEILKTQFEKESGGIVPTQLVVSSREVGIYKSLLDDNDLILGLELVEDSEIEVGTIGIN